MNRRPLKRLLLLAVLLALTPPAYAAAKHKATHKTAKTVQQAEPAKPSAQLLDCLKQAEEQPDQAYADAQLWQKQKPASREAKLCLATAMYERGDYASAGPRFETLAKGATPQRHAAALYEKAGWSSLRLGDSEKAEDMFSNAIERAPVVATYWVDRALACMLAERFWDAKEDLNRAIALDNRLADAYAYRAQVWDELANITNARMDAEAALDLDPHNALAQRIYAKYKKKTPAAPPAAVP